MPLQRQRAGQGSDSDNDNADVVSKPKIHNANSSIKSPVLIKSKLTFIKTICSIKYQFVYSFDAQITTCCKVAN